MNILYREQSISFDERVNDPIINFQNAELKARHEICQELCNGTRKVTLKWPP